MDQPDDGAPWLAGAQVDVRWFLLDDVFCGGLLAWSGGADDRNPERVLLTQKAEALAMLGYHLSLADGFGVAATARVGVIGIDGWPRGSLPRLRKLAPAGGAELSGIVQLGRWWGHPVALEPRIGYNNARIDGAQVGYPTAGFSLTSRLDAHD